jgi:hypothetical protein
MTGDVDSRILRRFKDGFITIIPSMYCNTWNTYRHKGWRGFLIYGWRPFGLRFLRAPKKWFKPERKERIFYFIPGDKIVCSFENYARVKELVGEQCAQEQLKSDCHSAKGRSTVAFGDTSPSPDWTGGPPPASPVSET